ncbi:MAG: hypothetical protein AAF378_18700 [Cyanobacteria bacterium P01_A01_bin.84]
MHLGKFDEKRYPDKKCPYGFTCENHLWGVNKHTKDCKYYDDCQRIVKKLIKVSANKDLHEQYIDKIAKESKKSGDEALKDNRVECYSGTPQQSSLHLKAIEKHERSVIFLKERGNHQSPESLGVSEQIEKAQKLLRQLESKLKTFNRGYIAPEEVKMKTCNPKRDSDKEQQPKTYNYYKLQSKTAQFKSETKANSKCKSIYLGKVGDEKYVQGKLGIERRKRLLKIRTQLMQAVKAIEEATALADAEFNIDLYTANNEDGN